MREAGKLRSDRFHMSVFVMYRFCSLSPSPKALEIGCHPPWIAIVEVLHGCQSLRCANKPHHMLLCFFRFNTYERHPTAVHRQPCTLPRPTRHGPHSHGITRSSSGGCWTFHDPPYSSTSHTELDVSTADHRSWKSRTRSVRPQGLVEVGCTRERGLA